MAHHAVVLTVEVVVVIAIVVAVTTFLTWPRPVSRSLGPELEGFSPPDPNPAFFAEGLPVTGGDPNGPNGPTRTHGGAYLWNPSGKTSSATPSVDISGLGNDGKFRAPAAGWYAVSASVSNLPADAGVFLRRNGNIVQTVSGNGAGGGHVNVSAVLKLAAGDAVDVWGDPSGGLGTTQGGFDSFGACMVAGA